MTPGNNSLTTPGNSGLLAVWQPISEWLVRTDAEQLPRHVARQLGEQRRRNGDFRYNTRVVHLRG